VNDIALEDMLKLITTMQGLALDEETGEISRK
jgi:hypothetical protein